MKFSRNQLPRINCNTLLVLSVAVAITLGLGVFVTTTAGQTPTMVGKDAFPALEVVYDEIGTDTQGKYTKTWKLTWRDREHWRKELIDMSPRQSGRFDLVGYYEEANGRTFVSQRPNAPQISNTNELPTFPWRWFVPGRLSDLRNSGANVQVARMAANSNELRVTYFNEEYRVEATNGVPLEVSIDGVRFISKSLTLK